MDGLSDPDVSHFQQVTLLFMKRGACCRFCLLRPIDHPTVFRPSLTVFQTVIRSCHVGAFLTAWRTICVMLLANSNRRRRRRFSLMHSTADLSRCTQLVSESLISSQPTRVLCDNYTVQKLRNNTVKPTHLNLTRSSAVAEKPRDLQLLHVAPGSVPFENCPQLIYNNNYDSCWR